MEQSKKRKFILSFFSAIILKIGTSSLAPLGNFNVYIVSYIHHFKGQEYVNLQYGNLMVPLLTFAMTCFSPLAGFIEVKVGPKNTILIGEIILLIFICLLLFQRNIWLIYILFFGLGFGNSIMSFIPIKNACFYYPEYKAIIPSIISSITMVFTAIYNILGEKIINPNTETVINNFYSIEVSRRNRIYFVVIAIASTIGALISYLMIIPYDQSFDNKIDKNKLIEAKKNQICQIIDEKKDLLKNELIMGKIEKAKEQRQEYKKNLKLAMSNYRIWLIATFTTLGTFTPGFLFTTFRVFVSLTQTDPEDGAVIQYLGAIITIGLCIFSPLWGFFWDKLGFRPIAVIVFGLGIINSIGIMLFLNNKWIYRILLCFSGIMVSGLLTSINPHVMEVYGIKYTLELNGIIGLFAGLGNLGGAIVSFVFGIFWTTGEEIIFPYKIVFTLGSIFSIIAFILQWFEPNKPFVFDENNKQIKESKEGKLEKTYISSTTN